MNNIYIFKTSGKTFHNVIRYEKHAFASKPRNWFEGEVVLVSKIKRDLIFQEKQIQYVMRIQNIREIEPGEAEKYWPGNAGRWNYLVECYDTKKLRIPFDLVDLIGKGVKKYNPVQSFKRIESTDKEILSDYLQKINCFTKDQTKNVNQANLEELQRLNNDFKNTPSKKRESFSKTIERNPRITALLKQLHPKKCQVCKASHFRKKDGDAYSEVHHIVPLSRGGSQATDNCLILCATCHRKMHYADVEIDMIDENTLNITINEESFKVMRNILTRSDIYV